MFVTRCYSLHFSWKWLFDIINRKSGKKHNVEAINEADINKFD